MDDPNAAENGLAIYKKIDLLATIEQEESNVRNSVTNLQVFSLYSLYIFTTIIAFLLGLLIEGSKFSTPVATIAGGFLGFLLTYPAYKVGVTRPTEFLGDYGCDLVGKLPHVCFMTYIFVTNLLLAVINLRELSDFLLSEYLLGTPGWAIVIIFMVCVAYAIFCGIETIFEIAQGIFLVSALAFLLIPILAYQELETDMFIALFTHLKAREIGKGMIESTLMFGQMSFLFLMFPYLKTPKKTYRTFFFTTCSIILVVLAHVISVLLTFGPELGANLMYPDMDLVRFVRVGSFIESFDPILIVLFLTSVFVKISFNVFICVLCLSHLTGIKNYRMYTLPIAAFVAVYSLVVIQSQPELFEFFEFEFAVILMIGEFLIPWIYWMMLLIRGGTKKGKPADKLPAGT